MIVVEEGASCKDIRGAVYLIFIENKIVQIIHGCNLEHQLTA